MIRDSKRERTEKGNESHLDGTGGKAKKETKAGDVITTYTKTEERNGQG